MCLWRTRRQPAWFMGYMVYGDQYSSCVIVAHFFWMVLSFAVPMKSLTPPQHCAKIESYLLPHTLSHPPRHTHTHIKPSPFASYWISPIDFVHCRLHSYNIQTYSCTDLSFMQNVSRFLNNYHPWHRHTLSLPPTPHKTHTQTHTKTNEDGNSIQLLSPKTPLDSTTTSRLASLNI